MAQPAELLDALALDLDCAPAAADLRPISARLALTVWIGLSLGGWGVIAALVGLGL